MRYHDMGYDPPNDRFCRRREGYTVRTRTTPRSWNSRWWCTYWLAPFAAFTLLTGCVADGDETAEEPGAPNGADGAGEEPGDENSAAAGEPIASSQTTATQHGPDLRLDITALQRESDELMRLEFTVVNESDEDANLLHALAGTTPNTMRSGEAIYLIDAVNGKEHRPFMTSGENSECYCSTWDGTNLPSGEQVDGWVGYPAAPSDVESLIVHTPITPPIMDVPISEGDGEEMPDNLADPIVLDLVNHTDESEGGRQETGDETSLLLSTDVLFDIDESEITSEAEDTLEDAAVEIDESDADTVEIEGHTDSTGDDSINDPLSEDRAEAVRDELTDLVDREMDFTTEGYGSSDPIADNGTEEGREMNRRVTVTFQR